MSIRSDAEKIIRNAIYDTQPDVAVRKMLENSSLPDCVHIIAVGKAACVFGNIETYQSGS